MWWEDASSARSLMRIAFRDALARLLPDGLSMVPPLSHATSDPLSLQPYYLAMAGGTSSGRGGPTSVCVEAAANEKNSQILD